MTPLLTRILYRLARAYWRLAQPVSVGVKGIVWHDGRVLLVRHTYGDRRLWALPGGHVRRHEAAPEALAREVREECGMTVRVGRLVGIYYHAAEFKHDHILVFTCDPVTLGENPRSAEIEGFAFFDPTALPTVVAGTGDRLHEAAADGGPIVGRW